MSISSETHERAQDERAQDEVSATPKPPVGLLTPALRPSVPLDIVDAFFAGFGSAFGQFLLSVLAVFLGMVSSLVWLVAPSFFAGLFPFGIILMLGEWNSLGGWFFLGLLAFFVGTISAVAFAMGHGSRRLWLLIYGSYFLYAFAPHFDSFTWNSFFAILTALGMGGLLWGLPWLIDSLASGIRSKDKDAEETVHTFPGELEPPTEVSEVSEEKPQSSH